MPTKSYYTITATLFLIIALLHLARVLFSWPAVIGSVEVPFWMSWVAVLLAGYLSYRGFTSQKGRASKKK